MIKKNLTGQTVAIIILAILLVGAIAFAGVFAYYSSNSNKVAGKITLATLKIDFDEVGASSGTSEVLITNSSNVVPNEGMQNTPLTIINDSTKPIYLVVLYNLETRDKKGNDLNLDATPKQPVIDIGSNYDNEFYPSTNVTGRANEWQDFVYA